MLTTNALPVHSLTGFTYTGRKVMSTPLGQLPMKRHVSDWLVGGSSPSKTWKDTSSGLPTKLAKGPSILVFVSAKDMTENFIRSDPQEEHVPLAIGNCPITHR